MKKARAPLQPIGDGLRDLALGCLLAGVLFGAGLAVATWYAWRFVGR